MSKRDSYSSSRTGVSTQIEVEGTWDENIPLEQLHDSILHFLTDKLEKLRHRYIQVRQDKKENVMGRIVKYRMAYQKFVHITKDILQQCDSFLKDRRDSPGSRIAYINNVQQYISQAKEFVKIDLKFKRISPSLLTHLEPTEDDTADSYKRKRYLKNTIYTILNNEKMSCLTSSGVGKIFRSRHNHQSKFVGRAFNSNWISILKPGMSEVISLLERDEEKWAAMLVYLYSKDCSNKYVHNGFCPTCLFPIIIPRETNEGSSGTIYCPACFKEITWTYFISHDSIREVFSQFHPDEIDNILTMVKNSNGGGDDDDFYSSIINNITDTSRSRQHSQKPNWDTVTAKTRKTTLKITPPLSVVSVKVLQQRFVPRQDSFKVILSIITKHLKMIFKNRDIAIDRKNIKDNYDQFASDIYNIEGIDIIKLPRGIIPAIKRYVTYYHSSEETITRKMIYDALMALGYEEYTKHISYIANKMYNQPFPDFSRNRQDIIIECVLFKIIFGIISSSSSNKRVHANNYYIIHNVLVNNNYDSTDHIFRLSIITRKKQSDIMEEICRLIYPLPNTEGPSGVPLDQRPPHQ